MQAFVEAWMPWITLWVIILGLAYLWWYHHQANVDECEVCESMTGPHLHLEIIAELDDSNSRLPNRNAKDIMNDIRVLFIDHQRLGWTTQFVIESHYKPKREEEPVG